MEGCGVSSLPEDFGELSTLQDLNISHNWKLTKLPDSFGRLKALVCLDAGYCQLCDNGLPVGLSELTMLRIMNLEHNRFTRFPAGLKNLNQLRELLLDGCTKLRVLPELPPSLKILSIRRCRGLTGVTALRDLEQLIKFDAMLCDQLFMLYGLEYLQALTSLNLMGCKNISTKSLESCLGGLPSLQCLLLGGAGITSNQLQSWYDSITKAIPNYILCNSNRPSPTSPSAEAEGKKGEEKLCIDVQNKVYEISGKNKKKKIEIRYCAGYIVCSVVFVDNERDSNDEWGKRLRYSIERDEKQTEVIHPEMRVEGGSGHVLELRIVRAEENSDFQWLRMGSKFRVKASSDYDQWKAHFTFLMHQSPPSTSCNGTEETQPPKITFGMDGLCTT